MEPEKKIGKLTVIREVDKLILPSGQKNRAFLCKCDCGNEKIVRLVHLNHKRILSCGCSKNTRNGRGNTRLCKIWRAMNYRCGKGYTDKHLYFDKGITVCDEWEYNYFAFENWSLSNGYEKTLQIDRRDNSKGYSPDNCRWVTSQINCNNRDVTTYVNYNGSKVSLKILLKELNKSDSYYTIRGRINRGWEHQRAIDIPVKDGNYKKNEQ